MANLIRWGINLALLFGAAYYHEVGVCTLTLLFLFFVRHETSDFLVLLHHDKLLSK